jgi:hypothetical protein
VAGVGHRGVAHPGVIARLGARVERVAARRVRGVGVGRLDVGRGDVRDVCIVFGYRWGGGRGVPMVVVLVVVHGCATFEKSVR